MSKPEEQRARALELARLREELALKGVPLERIAQAYFDLSEVVLALLENKK